MTTVYGKPLAGAASNFAAGVTVRRHLRATLIGSGLLIADSALLLATVTVRARRPSRWWRSGAWASARSRWPRRAGWPGAIPANVEGGLALFVSALQGSLAAGSAVGGVVYDAAGPGPGG
jgi:predicted MFS family arabinose efflux permease